jgi:glycerol-3-phosphate dehydrogenase
VASGIDDAARDHLAARYGFAANEVVAIARANPALAEPIVNGLPDRLAEVALAVRKEQAQTIGDVLLRRTRLGILAARELVAGSGDVPMAVQHVAGVMADELDWDDARKSHECDEWQRVASAEGILP